jgi:hypothetical protein
MFDLRRFQGLFLGTVLPPSRLVESVASAHRLAEIRLRRAPDPAGR